MALLLFLSWPLAATSAQYGLDHGWQGTLSSGLTETKGWQGKNAITLLPFNHKISSTLPPSEPFDMQENNIDMLILGDLPGATIEYFGHYLLSGSWDISPYFTARGNNSIRSISPGIILLPTETAIWWPGEKWSDFTLDMRLRPSRLTDREVILSWKGKLASGRTQNITVYVENRRIIWNFKAFFVREEDKVINVTLKSMPLIPGIWNHHRIRFKSEYTKPDLSGASPGLLEYLVNGIPVDMIHTTATGRESKKIFSPRIGLHSDQPIIIGESFNGYFDEIQLSRTYISEPPNGLFSSSTEYSIGRGRTMLADAGSSRFILSSLRTRWETPGESRIRIFVYSTNSYSENLSLPYIDDPNWVELTMIPQAMDLQGQGRWYSWDNNNLIPGRYYSIGYILESDPENDVAPIMHCLNFQYIENPFITPGPAIPEFSQNRAIFSQKAPFAGLQDHALLRQ